MLFAFVFDASSTHPPLPTPTPHTCADFDGDGYLDKKDLMDTIERLCGTDGLSEYERDLVADKILEEADLDGDHRLSYVEFEHVISRAPDFVNTFRIRI